MNLDELRDTIWEHLFRVRATKTVGEIAALTGCDAAIIRAAVDHEWFTVSGDRVSVAYSGPSWHRQR